MCRRPAARDGVRRPVSICATEFLSTSTGRATIVYDGINNWPRIGPATYCTTTQEDELRREANPQLDKHLKASPQVAESAPRTLSRWRHGFEPRWDYKRKTPGQGASPGSIGSLNRDSNAEYPANIPHRIERSECAKGRARRGWMHYRRGRSTASRSGAAMALCRARPSCQRTTRGARTLPMLSGMASAGNDRAQPGP